GVSGGTVALVFGIYTTLVAQIRQGARALAQLVRGRPGECLAERRRVDWLFLLPLLGGIGIALVSLASIISHYLEEEPIRTAAVFLGLVVGSLFTTVHLVHRWGARAVSIAAAAAVVTFVALGFGSGQVQDPAL